MIFKRIKDLFKRPNPHKHDVKGCVKSFFLVNGDLVMKMQWECSCGHKHKPELLGLAKKSELDEAYNNKKNGNQLGDDT